MYYGPPPPQASAEPIRKTKMWIQTTAVVIGSTGLLTSSLHHMQGSVEIEPCGLRTFEQWGINSLETKVLCMDIQVMLINHLGLLNESLCSPYLVPSLSVHIQHPEPPFTTCLWEGHRLTLYCLCTYHHHDLSDKISRGRLTGLASLVVGRRRRREEAGRCRVERKKWHSQQYFFSNFTTAVQLYMFPWAEIANLFSI